MKSPQSAAADLSKYMKSILAEIIPAMVATMVLSLISAAPLLAAEGSPAIEGVRDDASATLPAKNTGGPIADARHPQALTNTFFPFDSGVGRGKWTPQEQAQCVGDLGFDGIGYNYNEKKPELLDEWLTELHQRGLKLVDIYSGLTFPKTPGARPNDFLRDPIRKLKGMETVLWVPIWGHPHDEPFDDEALK